MQCNRRKLPPAPSFVVCSELKQWPTRSLITSFLPTLPPSPLNTAIRCDKAISDTVQGQQQGSVTADMLAALRLERDQVQHVSLPLSASSVL